jgi:hypothetical protein
MVQGGAMTIFHFLFLKPIESHVLATRDALAKPRHGEVFLGASPPDPGNCPDNSTECFVLSHESTRLKHPILAINT